MVFSWLMGTSGDALKSDVEYYADKARDAVAREGFPAQISVTGRGLGEMVRDYLSEKYDSCVRYLDNGEFVLEVRGNA